MSIRRRNRIDGVRLSYDLTLVVDKQRFRIGAAQVAHLYHSVLPDRGPVFLVGHCRESRPTAFRPNPTAWP